jgi:hypothetical protein
VLVIAVVAVGITGVQVAGQERAAAVQRNLEVMRIAVAGPPATQGRPLRPGTGIRNCTTGTALAGHIGRWQPVDAALLGQARAASLSEPLPATLSVALQRLDRPIATVLGVTHCRHISQTGLDEAGRTTLEGVAALAAAEAVLAFQSDDARAAQRWALDLWTLGEDLEVAHDTDDHAMGLAIAELGITTLADVLTARALPPGAAYDAMRESRLLHQRPTRLERVVDHEASALRRSHLTEPVADPSALLATMQLHGRYMASAAAARDLPLAQYRATLSRWQRTVAAGPPDAAALTPPLSDLLEARLRVETLSGQVLLLAAVRDYRERHGTCPATLVDALVPPLDRLPLDPYTGEAYEYEGCGVHSDHADWYAPLVPAAPEMPPIRGPDPTLPGPPTALPITDPHPVGAAWSP